MNASAQMRQDLSEPIKVRITREKLSLIQKKINSGNLIFTREDMIMIWSFASSMAKLYFAMGDISFEGENMLRAILNEKCDPDEDEELVETGRRFLKMHNDVINYVMERCTLILEDDILRNIGSSTDRRAMMKDVINMMLHERRYGPRSNYNMKYDPSQSDDDDE